MDEWHCGGVGLWLEDKDRGAVGLPLQWPWRSHVPQLVMRISSPGRRRCVLSPQEVGAQSPPAPGAERLSLPLRTRDPPGLTAARQNLGPPPGLLCSERLALGSPVPHRCDSFSPKSVCGRLCVRACPSACNHVREQTCVPGPGLACSGQWAGTV